MAECADMELSANGERLLRNQSSTKVLQKLNRNERPDCMRFFSGNAVFGLCQTYHLFWCPNNLTLVSSVPNIIPEVLVFVSILSGKLQSGLDVSLREQRFPFTPPMQVKLAQSLSDFRAMHFHINSSQSLL